MAKRLIEDIISNETIKAASKVGQAPTTVHEMMIPGNLVARVIGKGGEVIKALQEETGARVVIIQVRREANKLCSYHSFRTARSTLQRSP